MAAAREAIRPYLPAAAAAAGALLAAGIFRAAAGAGLAPGARGAAAVGATIFLLSLVIPALSVAWAGRAGPGGVDDLFRWVRLTGGVLGGAALGMLLLAHL